MTFRKELYKELQVAAASAWHGGEPSLGDKIAAFQYMLARHEFGQWGRQDYLDHGYSEADLPPEEQWL